MNILQTPINHESRPHCCGCWDVIYDAKAQELLLICNECGCKVPLKLPKKLDILGGELALLKSEISGNIAKLKEAQQWFKEQKEKLSL